jgi:DnaK suppressor protein
MRSPRAANASRDLIFMAKSKKKAAPHKSKKLAVRKPAKLGKRAGQRPAGSKAKVKTKPGAARRRAGRMHTSDAPTEIFRDNHKPRRLDAFTKAQKQKLLQLRDAMVDSMAGVAQDTLRSRAEGSEASAFGMHQADAGSDAYDRDFALSLLSQEQDALYEIDQALKRIELGTYGICEMSGKPIPRARLEAIPFARFTVECQSQLEKQNKASRVRQSVTSLFGLTEEEAPETEEEEQPAPTAEKE